MKNPMFLMLWLCSVGALVLAYFKILHRQWFPAGLLLLIGVGTIFLTVWILRDLNRLEIPIAADSSAATIEDQDGPIVMQLSKQSIAGTLLWAMGFLVGAIALVQYPDILWRWWLSYPAAFVLMFLMAALLLVATNQKLERIAADSNGIEVRTEARGQSAVCDTKVAWRDVGAVKRNRVYRRKTRGVDEFMRNEIVLLDHEGNELLNLDDPLDPPQAFQRFLDSIPKWTNLTIQNERVTK